MKSIVNQRLLSGWDCHLHLFDANTPQQNAHYKMGEFSLSDMVQTAMPCGIEHLVFIQPSVYGTDHFAIENALAQSDGKHRAVVTLSHIESDKQLEKWHALGVRGARYNCVSTVGNPMIDWTIWRTTQMPRLQALKWHVQWYAEAAQLPQLAAWQSECSVPFVVDHLARMDAEALHNESYWDALEDLAAHGAWIKLSGAYRLGLRTDQSLFDLGQTHIKRILKLFKEHCIWGSDWPHTGIDRDKIPNYANMIEQMLANLGAHQAQDIFCDAPARLYL